MKTLIVLSLVIHACLATSYPLEEGSNPLTLNDGDELYFFSLAEQWTIKVVAEDWHELQNCRFFVHEGSSDWNSGSIDLGSSRGDVYTNKWGTGPGVDVTLEFDCYASPLLTVWLVNEGLEGVSPFDDAQFIADFFNDNGEYYTYLAPECAWDYRFQLRFPNEGYTWTVKANGQDLASVNDVATLCIGDACYPYFGEYLEDWNYATMGVYIPSEPALHPSEGCDVVERKIDIELIRGPPVWLAPVIATASSIFFVTTLYCCGFFGWFGGKVSACFSSAKAAVFARRSGVGETHDEGPVSTTKLKYGGYTDAEGKPLLPNQIPAPPPPLFQRLFGGGSAVDPNLYPGHTGQNSVVGGNAHNSGPPPPSYKPPENPTSAE